MGLEETHTLKTITKTHTIVTLWLAMINKLFPIVLTEVACFNNNNVCVYMCRDEMVSGVEIVSLYSRCALVLPRVTQGKVRVGNLLE